MKKKILIRIGSLRHGGAEKVLVTFLKNLPEDKYEIDLLLNLYSGKYLTDVPNWVNVMYLNRGEMITNNRPKDIPKKTYRVVYQGLLKKYPKILYKGKLKNKVYDIEFAAIHGMYEEILKSPQKNSKKIIWVQNDIFNLKEYTPEIIKKFFSFDSIMVISNKLKQEMYKLTDDKMLRERIVQVYNPIDAQDTLRKADLAINDYPFRNQYPTFVTVGTVYPQKGYDRLLNVHKKLLDNGFSHNLLIIGDGYDFNNIQKLLQKLQLHKTAKMLGFNDNPYPYIKKADFYVMSSRHEGFPTIIAEALILNKPIIATDVSGVRDLLQDGKLGLIVQNSDDGIYEGMRSFISQKGLADQYIQEIAITELPFKLKYSVDKIMEIIDNL
ncbi:MAG: glycosyltransferase [Weeksellaceae bacterium]|nr:glycosyltransferase [Weeksellaceae bacterium]